MNQTLCTRVDLEKKEFSSMMQLRVLKSRHLISYILSLPAIIEYCTKGALRVVRKLISPQPDNRPSRREFKLMTWIMKVDREKILRLGD